MFLAAYVAVLFISLIHGLYIYPYYDLIFNLKLQVQIEHL